MTVKMVVPTPGQAGVDGGGSSAWRDSTDSSEVRILHRHSSAPRARCARAMDIESAFRSRRTPMPDPATLAWTATASTIIDQTACRTTSDAATLDTLEAAAHAIRSMQVRGAPLIGVTAAYGVALALRTAPTTPALTHAAAHCWPRPGRRPSICTGRWRACTAVWRRCRRRARAPPPGGEAARHRRRGRGQQRRRSASTAWR